MFHRHPIAHRLFFALRPPPETARRIVAAAPWFGRMPGALTAERLHITLAIGDDHTAVPAGFVEALRLAGDQVAAAPFEMILDRTVGSPASIALRPSHAKPALTDLHDGIVRALSQVGIAQRQHYRFSPHMTLGYRSSAPFSEPIRPVSWMAEDFLLVHSHFGRTRHEVAGRWRLTAIPRQPTLF